MDTDAADSHATRLEGLARELMNGSYSGVTTRTGKYRMLSNALHEKTGSFILQGNPVFVIASEFHYNPLLESAFQLTTCVQRFLSMIAL